MQAVLVKNAKNQIDLSDPDDTVFDATAQALLTAAPEAVMVHGEVEDPDIPGRRFWHAWIEFDIEYPDGCPVRMVRDISRGANFEIPAAAFYLFAKVIDHPDLLHRYTRNEVAKILTGTRSFGPRDQSCERTSVEKINCPDCNTAPGQKHRPGCDLEECPYCERQLLACGCGPIPKNEKIPWTGYLG